MMVAIIKDLGLDHFPQSILANSDFEIWQRGAGPFTVVDTFSADEWQIKGTGVPSIQRNASPKIGNYCIELNTGTGTDINLQQGVECYKSLEGLWLTASCWVKSNYAGFGIYIQDYNGTLDSGSSVAHNGDNTWQRLTAVKKVRTGLLPTVLKPHSYGLSVILGFVGGVPATGKTAYFDGAMLVVGAFPDGVDFEPLPKAVDMQRCSRYYTTDGGAGGYIVNSGNIGGINIFYYGNAPDFPCEMVASPTITAIPVAASFFPNSVGTLFNSKRRIYERRQAVDTNPHVGGFTSSWTAEIV